MKNQNIKALVLALAMVGVLQAQATEKTVVEKVKETVKAIDKALNKDYSKKCNDGFTGGATRG
jgi:hypothetical protein